MRTAAPVDAPTPHETSTVVRDRGGTISTIEDVARLAGVSRGSASNVLTGKVRMREATRERVLAAAKTLGYRPNRVASALASGRYPAVAMLVADITNLVNADLVKAVEAICATRNYSVTICHTNRDGYREQDHLGDLLGYRVAGVLAKAWGADVGPYRQLLDAGTRIVLIDNPIHDLDLPIVWIDRMSGYRAALAWLARAGHRRKGAIVTQCWRSSRD